MIEIPPIAPVPYGYCACRCGESTSIARATCSKYGWIKGEPKRFVNGHFRRIRPVMEAAEPFKIEGVYCRLVPLTQNQYAIVWESDYIRVMEVKWCAFCAKDRLRWYATRGMFVDGRQYSQTMHEFLIPPPPPGKTIDHRNGLALDNRGSNLRYAFPREQQLNQAKKRNSSNLYKGYVRFRNKFHVQIRFGGERISIKMADTELEAALAFDEAALKYYGEFARLNFPSRVYSPHAAPAETPTS